MDSLLASFSMNPGLRLLAGLVFFILLGWWFFRQFQGRGKLIFLATCLALGLVFLFSPAIQLIAFLALAVLLVWSLVRSPPTQPEYLPAETLVEGGGLKRGLTAPEAAVVLQQPLNRVLCVVVLGLLRKGVLEIQQNDPLVLSVKSAFLMVEAGDPRARAWQRREFAQRHSIVLHSYEDPFIEQIDSVGNQPLGEVNFTAAARVLIRQTARRVQGHSLAETRSYYQNHLGRAQHDVEFRVQGPDGPRIRDQFFEWLVLDPDFASLYKDYQPDWLVGGSDGPGGATMLKLVDWVEGLVETLGSSIPPNGLQVRTEQGEKLAIGGTEPVSEPFLEAIKLEL